MEIKGTSLKTTENFVKTKFPQGHNPWLNSLPKEIADYFNDGILIANWYPLIESVIIPTKKIGELFYNNDYKKAAFDVGYFSAVEALNGIYKIFVKVASIDFVIKRSTAIFSTFYKTGVLELVEATSDKVILRATGFKKEESEIFDRVSGWIKGIFDTISTKNFQVTYTIEEKANGFVEAIFLSKWR